MVRKLMALGALTFVTGIVTTLTAAGCTSDDGAGDEADAGRDVGGDVKPDRPSVPDPDDDAGGSTCPADVPLTAADLDEEIGWKPAKAAPGSCTQADLSQLEKNFDDTTIKTYFDLGNGLDPACKACVFSKDTDESWGPIVGTAENDGETGFINFGACFGSIEGDDCGKALQYEQLCYNVACNECATTQTERTKCVQGAGNGMCKDFGEATATACPDVQSSAAKCNDVLAAAQTLCGSTGDAGADGGG